MGAISEAFVAYAQPLIDQTDGSEEQLNEAFSLSQLCFNLAQRPENKRDEALKEMKQSLQMDDEEFEDFCNSIVLPMIQRHHEMFPLKRMPRWAIPSESDSSRARAEENPRIDRYAPCPCNSGRKYKFCCGKAVR